MTPRQAQVLNVVRAYWKVHGYSPAYEDIRAAIGAKSRSTARELVKQLVRQGYLYRPEKRARAIQLTEAAKNPGRVVVAGSSNFEDQDASFSVPGDGLDKESSDAGTRTAKEGSELDETGW